MAIILQMKKTDKRIGRQTPTRAVILPFDKTLAHEALSFISNQAEKLISGKKIY